MQDKSINEDEFLLLGEIKKIDEYKIKNNLKPSSEVKNETLEEENKRLRKELAILKQEKEILKKAAAYFAKETL